MPHERRSIWVSRVARPQQGHGRGAALMLMFVPMLIHAHAHALGTRAMRVAVLISMCAHEPRANALMRGPARSCALGVSQNAIGLLLQRPNLRSVPRLQLVKSQVVTRTASSL